MPERTYTLDEIDQMRYAVRESMMIKHGEGEYACYVSHHTPEEIEARLRTYMAAGIDPEELTKGRRWLEPIQMTRVPFPSPRFPKDEL